jgi:hypothetical protein
MATLKDPIAPGRPRKYAEPSSPITLTLPNRILKRLEQIDKDRGKAIVKCVESLTDLDSTSRGIKIVKATEESAIIVVPTRSHLETIPWLRLVEIAPAQFLLSMPGGTHVSLLEVAILDLLEHLPDDDGERLMLEELRHYLTTHRRKSKVSKGEILFVEL